MTLTLLGYTAKPSHFLEIDEAVSVEVDDPELEPEALYCGVLPARDLRQRPRGRVQLASIAKLLLCLLYSYPGLDELVPFGLLDLCVPSSREMLDVG